MPTHLFIILSLVTLIGSDANAAIADSLLRKIFPFEVGQQYQFKSGMPFRTALGMVLPANTVAEITITDTVIDGKTWLFVPYWSPFGEDYYRIENGEIWERSLVSYRPHEDPFLGSVWEGPEGFPWDRWPYGVFEAYRPISYLSKDEASWYYDRVQKKPVGYQGRTLFAGTALYINNIYKWGESWAVGELHGAYGDGSSLHIRLGVNCEVLPPSGEDCPPDKWNVVVLGNWGLFRPKSDTPWPQFEAWWNPVIVTEDGPIPKTTMLATFPNPFNSIVTIRFRLPDAGPVTIRIYSITGQYLFTIAEYAATPGTFSTVWDGRDHGGRRLGSGVYIVELRTKKESIVRRIILLR